MQFIAFDWCAKTSRKMVPFHISCRFSFSFQRITPNDLLPSVVFFCAVSFPLVNNHLLENYCAFQVNESSWPVANIGGRKLSVFFSLMGFGMKFIANFSQLLNWEEELLFTRAMLYGPLELGCNNSALRESFCFAECSRASKVKCLARYGGRSYQWEWKRS